MNTLELWHKLFSLSDGKNWVKIPQDLAQKLGIDSRLGILGNTLCTQAAATGIIRFVDRLNKITLDK